MKTKTVTKNKFNPFNYILFSLKNYRASYFKNDFLAGIVVAALTIPVAMGYAEVADLPPIYGLYASILPVLGYAIFASSRQLIFGLDASASAITGSVALGLGLAQGSHGAEVLAPVLALFTGVFLFLFAILKLGKFASYISVPVMSGFISGVALSIIVGQVPKLMGLTGHGTDFFKNVGEVIANFTSTNWISLVMAVLSIVIILTAKKWLPKWPMALFVLVLATIATYLLRLDQHGVAIVGAIPHGLPAISFPDFTAVPDIGAAIGIGFMIAVVVFADSLLSTNSFAAKGHYKLRENRELFAFGFSNVMSSLIGASPTSASVSRTAASQQFKGKTQMVAIIAAAVVAAIVAFASGALYYMPSAVLAAIIFAALVGVIEVRVARHLFERTRFEFVVWIVGVFGVLFIGVLFGVIIAVILSFADIIYRATKPPQAMLGKIPGRDGYFDLARHKDARAIDGVAIYRFSSPLFFANIDVFTRGVKNALKSNPRTLIIDASGISSVDVTATDDLKNLLRELDERHVLFYFAGEIAKVNDELARLGMKELVKSGHTQKTINDALVAAGVISLNKKEKEL